MRLRRSISDTSGGSCRLAVHPKVTKAHQVSKQYTSSTSIAIDYGAACTSQPPVFRLHNPIFYPKLTMVHKILFWSGFGTHPKPSQHIKSNTNHHQSLQASQSASGNSASKCVPSSTKNPFGRGPSSPPREEVSDIG